MSDMQHCNPECFGNLEKVFPMGENGLRQTPDECFFHCAVKTACLRQAIKGEQGPDLEEERLELRDKAGLMSFIERWSKKKQIHRKRMRNKK